MPGNILERDEMLLLAVPEAERERWVEAEATLTSSLASWNTFADEYGSFADEHTTL